MLAKQGIKQYVFISSVSVYSEEAMSKGTVDETSPVGKLPEGTEIDKIDRVTGENYGPMKALCEQAAEAAFPGRATNIRPGLIVGPGDSSDRYTYWPVRVDKGGEVLAPNCPETGVQYIDVRDLAEWTVKMIEDGHAGVYNALGPKHKHTWVAFLYACKAATTSDARFTWVDEQFLLDNGVGPWMELPLWIPSEGKTEVQRASNAKAVAVGLTFRPAAVTAMDTLKWAKAERGEREWGAGMKPEKEQQVLAAWQAKKSDSPTTKPG
jgi:2'-hydroxyisoflavone reductase